MTEQTGFASMIVNPFDGNEAGFQRAREQAAARGSVVPDGLRPGDAEVPAMILINLLPHREEKRRRRKQAFFATLGLSAAVGALVAVGWFAVLQQMISSQQDRNTFLKGRDRQARRGRSRTSPICALRSTR